MQGGRYNSKEANNDETELMYSNSIDDIRSCHESRPNSYVSAAIEFMNRSKMYSDCLSLC
jgi:hypothetical protein